MGSNLQYTFKCLAIHCSGQAMRLPTAEFGSLHGVARHVRQRVYGQYET